MEYGEFLKKKVLDKANSGFEIEENEINNILFPFQKDIVKWSLWKGKNAVFADTGLGKTFIQLEWARLIYNKFNKNILIIAPLAVSLQTQREGLKLGIKVNVCRRQGDVISGINITNYEMLEHFRPDEFIAVVLDESSILKNYTGKRKRLILDMFEKTEYKLACTATPSPNDHMEILNHAEFLNVMKSNEALAIWFINDTQNMGRYRIKNYARKNFWKWVSSWAISISKPSDFGYEDGGFDLPELNIKNEIIDIDICDSQNGNLFRVPELNATGYHREKRLTKKDRVRKVAEIVSQSDEIFCIWCDTNYEADALKKAIPEAIEVRGSDNPKIKEQRAIEFIEGKIRILISKPKIFGFGLNFQHCHNVIFCGLSYSYEMFYQSIRRFWRFGQVKPVNVSVVMGSTEIEILNVIKNKEDSYRELKNNMQREMNQYQDIKNKGVVYKMNYEKKNFTGNSFELIQGDAIEEIKHIKSDSVHFQIYSPPFSQLYIYSDSYRDMGNNKNDAEFFKHYNYFLPELYRILIPGRLAAVHCKQLVNYKNRDNQSGLRDFRGDIIRAHQKAGFVYHSEVCIWKDPVTEMYRTKAHGLLYRQLRNDSSYSRQGLPDYLILFRKWADEEDPEPIDWKTKDNFELEKWQKYASPVWFDINQMNVLNCKLARNNKDEKHICPLQLDVIERAIEMWSNPGDIIFSPFAGIGSEGYVALLNGRKFLGIELKDEYVSQAVVNLEEANRKKNEKLLFAI